MIRVSSLVQSLALLLTAGSNCLAQGIMYACQSGREYYTMNLATGAKTQIGFVGANVQISASLTYDCATQTTYVASTFAFAGVSRSLYRMNPLNGVATLVGPFGDPSILMHGLEIDARTGVLYGLSSHSGGLYRVNRTTGAATLIGLTGITGLGSFGNLGYDSHTCTMYATNALTDSLYRIDTSTAAATLVGPLNGPINIGGLAYNVDNRTMYLVDNDGDILYSVNLATGAATAIGPTGPGNLIGLVYITPTCLNRCVSDVDDGTGSGLCDGGVGIEDILFYLDLFDQGLPRADVDDGSATGALDGGVGIEDLLYYLARFEAGC
jgi:hypothetical protein